MSRYVTTLNDYQEQAAETAFYRAGDIAYVVLGLCAESGELANHYKKVLRDSGGRMNAVRHGKMVDELGDVLWYVSQLAGELGVSMAELASANLQKLDSRSKRGCLSGSGDNR